MSSQVSKGEARGGRARKSERFAYATLDALSEHIAVLDARGVIVAVNKAWREFAGANSLSPEGLGEGANYFAACERAEGEGAGDASRFAAGLRAVIGGGLDEFSLEYPCHSPTERRWFIARVTRFESGGEVRAVVTHANITQRRLAEEATRFRSHLLDTVEQAVIATDLGGTITYWNRFAEKLYGWPAAEIVGRNITEVVPPPAAHERYSEITPRLQAGQSWAGESAVRRRDGTSFAAFITDTPIYDDGGKMIGVVGISTDITEHKRAEGERERLLRTLEAERSRLDYLFTHSPTFVAVLRGPHHVFDLVNRPYMQLIGHRDVLGKSVRDALPEIEGQGLFELLDEVFRTGEPHVGRGVSVLIRRGTEGPPEERFLDFVYQPMFDADGSVSDIFVHGADITERKRAEDSLQKLSARLERQLHTFDTVVSSVQDFIYMFDLRGRFTYVNKSLLDLWQKTFEQAVGKDFYELDYPPDLAARLQRQIQEVITSRRPLKDETSYTSAFGTRGYEYIFVPIIAADGSVEAVAGVTRDITERKLAEQRLAQSEERLRAIFEASRDGIIVEDDERIAYVNDSYARLFGYGQPEELIGAHISAVTSPDDGERMLEFGRRRLRGEPAPAAYEFKGRRKDGALIALEASVSTHSVAGKTYITTAVRDISERKRAEAALQQSESMYRLLMEQASDGIHTYDPRGNFIETNSKLCEMLGYAREELLRLNVTDLIPPEDLASNPVRFDELRTGRTLLTERRLLRKDGTLLPVEISGRMIRDGVMQSIIRDISERKRAEEELHKAYDELECRVGERTAELARANAALKAEIVERRRAEEARKELLMRLVTAQEEERRRISRELHDQMGQQLAAVMMGLKTLDAQSHGRQPTLATLRQLQGLTGELSREVHTLAWGLRPPALDDLGLHTAIYNYVEEWAERSRVPVDFHSAGFEDRRLPFSHETALYRIAQEALTNVFKHSGADRVSFILEQRGDHVLAVIEDNGRGFDIESLTEPSGRGRRMGLLGMRERATLLGGTLAVESAPGAGTSVFVRIPVGAGGGEGGGSRG